MGYQKKTYQFLDEDRQVQWTLRQLNKLSQRMRDIGSDYESQQESKYSGSRKKISKQAAKPNLRNFYQVEMKNFNVWLHSIYNHVNAQIMSNVQRINQYLIECYPNTGEKVLSEFFRLQFANLPKSWHQYKVALIGYLQQDDTINRKKFQPSEALTNMRQKFMDHIVNANDWKTPKQGKGHASIQTLVERINTLDEAADDPEPADKPSNAIQPSTTPAQVNSRSPSSKRSPSRNTHEMSSNHSAVKLSPPRNIRKRVIMDDSESNKNNNRSTNQNNNTNDNNNQNSQQPVDPVEQPPKEDEVPPEKEDLHFSPFEVPEAPEIPQVPFEIQQEESQNSHHSVPHHDQPVPCPSYIMTSEKMDGEIQQKEQYPPPPQSPLPKQIFMMHSPEVPQTPVLMTPQEASHPQGMSPIPPPQVRAPLNTTPTLIPSQYLQALLQPHQQSLYQPTQMLQNLQQQQPPQTVMPPYPYFGVLQNGDPQNQQNMMFLQQVEMAQQRQFQLALNWLGYQNFLYTQYQMQLAREQQQQEQN